LNERLPSPQDPDQEGIEINHPRSSEYHVVREPSHQLISRIDQRKIKKKNKNNNHQ